MYRKLTSVIAPRQVTAPAAEPVTQAEAKKHLEIDASDTTHDNQINVLIAAARQKWESDTALFEIRRTMEIKLDIPQEFKFPHGPVDSITSITYFDTNATQQTLSTDIYELDKGHNILRLAYLKDWPSVALRWDAMTITYVLGEHTSATQCSEITKQAMLLLVGFWFENRDMMLSENMQSMAAYRQLVFNYQRSTYP